MSNGTGGESTKRTFSLGHKIDIIVNGVDMISKTIDFIIDEEAEELT